MDDNKIMEMFAQLLQGQTEMKMELKQDIQEVKSTISNLESKVSNLDSKVGNIEILMENVNKNVKIVAEGLSSHREQNDRQFSDLKEFIREENGIMKSIITDHSKKFKALR